MAKSAELLAVDYSPAVFGEASTAPSGAHSCASAIDLVHLSHQTLGDSELEADLLSLFDRQARQFAKRLSAPRTPWETKWRADLAHTLKGSARAIGAFEVGHAAEAYEQAILAGSAFVDEHWFRLEKAIGAASAAISHLLGRS